MIVLGGSRAKLESAFQQVEFVGNTPDNPYALEKDLAVSICRGSKFGRIEQFWLTIKKWR